jgi:hypothetical protein
MKMTPPDYENPRLIQRVTVINKEMENLSFLPDRRLKMPGYGDDCLAGTANQCNSVIMPDPFSAIS